MKLDYCNDHLAKGEKIETCLRIRRDDGKPETQREIWAEIVRLRNVVQAADELMAKLQNIPEDCVPNVQIEALPASGQSLSNAGLGSTKGEK